MTEVTARTLVRNSFFGVVEQVWRIGSRIILTPMIIHRMGMEGYGVWTLLFTICAYVNAVDANFGVAYNKLTAEYDAQRDYKRLSEIIGAGMSLVGLIAVIALSAIWLARYPILRLFNVPDPMLVDAGQALLAVSLCVVMRMSFGCAYSVLCGIQRTDLRNLLSIAASMIEFVVSIVLLLRGMGLLGLALGHMTGQILTTMAAWLLCRRLRPELAISPLHATRWGLWRIAAMGGRFQLLSVVQLLVNKGTKLFTAALLNVYYLGIVEVADKLITLGVAVGSGILAPVMPAFSNLQARGDERRIHALFERGSKMMAAVCLPCFAFLAIFAPQLIEIWTGQSFPLAAWTVRMIAPVAYLSMLTGMGTAVLRAQGNIRLELNYALIGAVVLAVFYYPGFRLAGYHGMIVVEVVAGLLAAAWFLQAFGRREKLTMGPYLWRVLARPVLVMGPMIGVALLVAPYWHFAHFHVSWRWNKFVDISLVGVIFVTVAAACAWFGMFNGEDRASLRGFLPLRRSASKEVGKA